MKIIIVGCGKIGCTVSRTLSTKKGMNVTVIDNNPSVFNNSAEPLDVISITGNGVNEKTLTEAGAKEADLIVSTTNADELNILCCIMAKHLGTKITVATVSDPNYRLEYNKLWTDLGIDMVINPERQTAREISRLLRYPTADGLDIFMDGRIELVSFKVADAPEYFVGKIASDVFDKKIDVLLVAIEKENQSVIPHKYTVFEQSDVVRILGRPSHVMEFLVGVGQIPKKQEIMVIGGSTITHYLVELLNRHAVKTNIKIIEKDQSKCEALYENLSLAELNRHCMFIHGDGANEDLLIAEGIDQMDACICLTDRDEENTIISLYALRRGIKMVITKVNHVHQNMIKDLDLGLDHIITPQEMVATVVSQYVDRLNGALGSNVRTIHSIFSGDDGNIDAVEFNVNKKAKCIGVPIGNLKIKEGVLIGCISRDHEIINPPDEMQIQPGDRVIIITKNNDIRDLDDIIANKFESSADMSKAEQ